jgi:hypothetical protein
LTDAAQLPVFETDAWIDVDFNITGLLREGATLYINGAGLNRGLLTGAGPVDFTLWYGAPDPKAGGG